MPRNTKFPDDEGSALPTTDELIALFSDKLSGEFLASLKKLDPLSAYTYIYQELLDMWPSTTVEALLVEVGLIHPDPNYPARVLSGEHV